MTLCLIVLVILSLVIIFIYWRTPWARTSLSPQAIKQWIQHDLNLKIDLPGPILEATFEGCRIQQTGDHFYFEVNGSKPIKLSLTDSSSHWLRSYNVPEMLAMYGLQYAACCLKRYTETTDNRWLNKFDRALEIAEVEARRNLKGTFFPWTEHAVALRMVSSRYCLYTIARYMENAGNAQMPARYERVLRIHLTATQLCLQPLLYDFITNHGLITDNSLLQCALTWPKEYPTLEKVLKVVSCRAEFAAVYFISPDGVPLEPATSYWYLIRRLLNDIKVGLQKENIKLSETFLSRIGALDAFLATTNMNGAVQRFGDSSGSHQIPLPFIAPLRKDGARLRVYDTGLILLNVVQGEKVVVQLMINAQNIIPRVHAQDDYGALAFYARETFWINSPGSYTALNLANRKVYTHYTNQSTVWHNSEHQGGCLIKSIQTEENQFVISLLIGTKIERHIKISRNGLNIQITDLTNDNSNLTTGILLAPGCSLRVENKGFTLLQDGKELPVLSNCSVFESPGYISYRRNEVIKTKSLRRSASLVSTQINLPEFKNLVVCLESSAVSSPQYIRQLDVMNYWAQCVRGLSIRKLKLVILVITTIAISSSIFKFFNK